ncbi:MAG: hypothetical protein DBX47_03035 [Clostridiales bacterium]|nr:MAG: hypothetical protein DBX47_03035 [Clostridiales bacterium]
MESSLVVNENRDNILDDVDILRIKTDRKINLPRAIFGYDVKRVDQTILELKDLFNTQNETFTAESDALKQECTRLLNTIDEQDKKINNLSNQIQEVQSELLLAKEDLKNSRLREDQHIAVEKNQKQQIEQQIEKIQEISLEIKEIEEIRKEKGELIAEKNFLISENNRLAESVERITEKNNKLNEMLERLKSEFRENKLLMIESMANLEASRKNTAEALTEKLMQSAQLVSAWQKESDAAVENIKNKLEI